MSAKPAETVTLGETMSEGSNTGSTESPRYSTSDTLTENGFSTSWSESKSKAVKPFSSNLLYNSLLVVLVAWITIAGLHLRNHSHSIQTSNTIVNKTENQPCGSDAISARHAGCLFDPLTFAWLPPACYDWNLTSEFLDLQDWEYYRQHPDGSRRQLSLINVMQSTDEVLYVSWEFHRQHCAYLGLKMHRAMLERRPIDGVSMMEATTGVCEDVLRSKREGNDTSVPGYIKYPSCKIY